MSPRRECGKMFANVWEGTPSCGLRIILNHHPSSFMLTSWKAPMTAIARIAVRKCSRFPNSIPFPRFFVGSTEKLTQHFPYALVLLTQHQLSLSREYSINQNISKCTVFVLVFLFVPLVWNQREPERKRIFKVFLFFLSSDLCAMQFL